MQRYSEYTAAPAAWLGDLPSHWDVEKIGSLFSERRTKVSDKDYPPLSVAKVGVVPQLATAVKTDAGDNRKLVCAGDFVINSRSDRKGSCGVSEQDGSVSLINIVLTPRNQWNSRYVHYLMRSHPFSEEYYRNGRGIVSDLWTTRYSEMKSILLPIPPHNEQNQIVHFLDWKVSTINTLINIKKREICEYEECKKAEFFRTVTRGLNEDIGYKSTDATWVQEIPKHWNMRRIKFLFDMRDERNYRPLSDVNLISLYTRLGVVQNKDVEYTTGNRARNADGYKIVHKNDIIVNIILCWMGAIGMSNYDGVTSPAYDIYIPKEGVHSRYYHYLFRTKAFSGECYKAGKGIMAMRWRTYSPQFRNISVPLPPLEEQIEIAAYLDERCATIDQQIEITQQQIQQLRELKDRLIADVVTGKIDVRNIQIPDYEYVDEEPDTVDNDEEPEEQEDAE